MTYNNNHKEYSKNTVGFFSLGCAKNLSDSEKMLGVLVQEGFQIVDPFSGCEIAIINTCTFIEDAKEESIETILKAVKLKTENKCRYIVVTGCLAQRYPKQLYELIPEADHIFGVSQIDQIGWICRNLPSRSEPHVETPTKLFPIKEYPKVHITPPHYAYLKISEGCKNNCSYCIIPFVRGTLRSRTPEDLYEEALFLNNLNVKELNIIAQDITQYGSDLNNGLNLPKFLRKLIELPSFAWIRLLYAYPTHISNELIELMATEEKIVPYLDIPIQHADSNILRKMGRDRNISRLIRVIESLRTLIPDISIRTTVMVGFPGETEEQFHTLLDFINEMKFDHLGVFRYSQESGTRAAKMKRQVSKKVKIEREERVLELQAEISRNNLKKYIGKELEVLLEGYIVDSNNKNYITARTAYQAPEIDGAVLINGDENEFEIGALRKAIITNTSEYDLFAKFLDY